MRRARSPFTSALAALAVVALAGGALVSASVASAATPPPAPTNVAQWGDRGIVYLSWYSGGGTTSGFNIYRGTSLPVALTNPLNGATPTGRWSYDDTNNLVGGTTYWYVIQAVNTSGDHTEAAAVASKPTASSTTSTPTATPTPTATSTPVPGTPALSATAGNAAVNLSWTKGTGTVDSWSLYRSTSASGVVAAGNLRAGNLTAATLSFNDTTVTNGTTYYYVVVATNGGGSTSSNQVTAAPSAPTPSATPTATGGTGSLVVSNPEWAMSPNRFVMSRMSYDPSPNSIVRMEDPDNNNALTYYKFNDVSTVSLKNTGASPLTVTSLPISVPRYFATTQTVPFTIAAGATKNIAVRFVFTGGNIFGADLREATLTVNATGVVPAVVQLAGIWQPGPNRYPGTDWNFEPSVALLTKAFGWTTNIGADGQLGSNNRTFAYGDEKLSSFWKAANPAQPVELQQLAAYNSGGFGQVNWYRSSDTQGCAWQTQASCKSIIYMADGNGATTTYPRLTSGVFPRPSYDYKIHPFTPNTTTFGFQVAGEFSDGSRNDATSDIAYHGCAPATQCGHHLRFFPAKNASGFIPNTFIIVVDQGGINDDFNDNVYVATNLAPVS